MSVVIARPSVASLLVVPTVHGQELSAATGFLVERNRSTYLVTNFHVLAGRDPVTRQSLHPSGAWPDEVVILHNVAGKLGMWKAEREAVRDGDGPRWFEHPDHGSRVDVVALELTRTDGYELHTHALDGGPDIAVGVAQQVSIIGFPFGRTGGGAFGIWIQGTIATELAVDFDDLPCFLIDARTRPGQSGSPVIFYSPPGIITTSDGREAASATPVEKLLGVYSGRINEQSDLGVVWRPEVVAQIIDARERGSD